MPETRKRLAAGLAAAFVVSAVGLLTDPALAAQAGPGTPAPGSVGPDCEFRLLASTAGPSTSANEQAYAPFRDLLGDPNALAGPSSLPFWFNVAAAPNPRPPACRAMTPRERIDYVAAVRDGLVALKEKRPADARAPLLRALGLQRRTLGALHHAVIGTVAALRDVFAAQDRVDEGLVYYRWLWEACIANFGFSNVCTWNAQANYQAAVPEAAERAFERLAEARNPLSALNPSQRQRYRELLAGYGNRVLQLANENFRKGLTEKLALEEAAWGEGSPRASDTYYALSLFYWRKSDFPRALDYGQKAFKAYESFLPPTHPYIADAHEQLARVYASPARNAEAISQFYAAYRHREANLGTHFPSTLDALQMYGESLMRVGRVAEGGAVLDGAYAKRTELNGAADFGSLINQASIVAENGDGARAARMMAEAIEKRRATAEPVDSNLIAALGRYGLLLLDIDRGDEGLPILKEAFDLHQQHFPDNKWERIKRLDNYGIGLYRLGRYEEAETIFEEAVALALKERGPSSWDARIEQENLAAARLRIPARARLAIESARPVWEAARKELAAIGLGPAESADLPALRASRRLQFTLFADAAWAASAVGGGAGARARRSGLERLKAESFEALQDAVLGSTSDPILTMAAREAAGEQSPQLRELVREREALSAEWRRNDEARVRSVADTAGGGNARLAVADSEERRIAEALAAIDRQVSARFRDYFAIVRPMPMSTVDARNLARPGEAILMIVPSEFGTHLILIRKDGLDWSRSAMTDDQMEAAVKSLRRNLEPREADAGSALRPFDRQLAHRLYKEIVGPFKAELAGYEDLMVVADGPLASLPLSVLVAEPPSGDDSDPSALRATAWLGDRFALSYAPSLQSLALLRALNRRPERDGPASAGFLGFGDPLLEGVAVTRGDQTTIVARVAAPAQDSSFRDEVVQSPALLRRLSRLPGTALELELVRQVIGAPDENLYLRDRATERRLKSINLSSTRILSFATHGLLAGQLAEGVPAGLVLTPPEAPDTLDDGLLTIGEIARLRLDADFVVLSACNSAVADTQVSGLGGLSQAFFYAGARSVLASHWPVRDDLAPRIVVRMIELHDKQGLPLPGALQTAEREVREDRDDARSAHPSAWAPFALFGNATP